MGIPKILATDVGQGYAMQPSSNKLFNKIGIFGRVRLAPSLRGGASLGLDSGLRGAAGIASTVSVTPLSANPWRGIHFAECFEPGVSSHGNGRRRRCIR